MTDSLIIPSGPKPKKFITLPRAVVYGVLILCSVFFLFPLYIMVITSLKDLDGIREGNLFTLSHMPTIAPWIKAWSQACTGLYCKGIEPGFINSLKITVPSDLVVAEALLEHA